ncbi:hypothetical protein PR202_gb05300 [Eleusine coracana subsp. coracana]|uniref:MPN domain-containing protein n=1 Tax=Eleusine coracana subsp. coracana TaxID=191504 RepID=A0AAV5E5U5_ELECO|nr:hypothetical protein PR202_gb05300 [Eleusine coracana subsp. coracana]
MGTQRFLRRDGLIPFPFSAAHRFVSVPILNSSSRGLALAPPLFVMCAACTTATWSVPSASLRLTDEFMELAKENTSNNRETCGILGASFRDGTYFVTMLIIPKQEGTAHSCQAVNEEEIHAVLSEQSLYPAGWIHTHPSQTCFLSSIDLHTQYSYQVMLPEAVAIVVAPTDPTRQVLST